MVAHAIRKKLTEFWQRRTPREFLPRYVRPIFGSIWRNMHLYRQDALVLSLTAIEWDGHLWWCGNCRDCRVGTPWSSVGSRSWEFFVSSVPFNNRFKTSISRWFIMDRIERQRNCKLNLIQFVSVILWGLWGVTSIKSHLELLIRGPSEREVSFVCNLH